VWMQLCQFYFQIWVIWEKKTLSLNHSLKRINVCMSSALILPTALVHFTLCLTQSC
jgi:hypothetical protein